MPTGDGVLAPVICRLGPIPIQIVGLGVGRGGWHEDLDTGVDYLNDAVILTPKAHAAISKLSDPTSKHAESKYRYM